MPSLKALIDRSKPRPDHHPWPRVTVTTAGWSRAIDMLASGQCDLVGLWGEADAVHMALREPATGLAGVLSLACPKQAYPAVSQSHPPALALERALADLTGLTPEGMPDKRPWLDHGRWPIVHPLAKEPGVAHTRKPYTFLATEGARVHQAAVGPVHAGIIEPGHFRFAVNGETVVRLERRGGYAHKGVERLLAGASLERGGLLAGRTSGDSTVAYQWAFAMAAEAALGVEIPSRAGLIRLVMAELERLANHLGDFGAICNDAAFSLMHAHTGVLREQVLRAADTAFGHRLMRDCVVPGGVAHDLGPAGIAAIRDVVTTIEQRLPELIDLYDNTASLQNRTVGTGVVSADLALRYAAGGFIGRAAGRAFDARKAMAYAPYDTMTFEVPVFETGDVDARVWVRIREIEQSLNLVTTALDRLHDGPISTGLPGAAGGEGIGMVEGFRGDILAWLRLDGEGRILRCHLRDPSWFQWPLIDAAVEGNIIADFPLCNKSFNCAYSGVDL